VSRIEVGGAGYEVAIGGRIDAALDGSAPPLLLIHGFTGSGADWAQIEPGLASEARTITVDLLGHGRSDSPADPAGPDPARYSIERQAADLAEILARLGAVPAVVAGYSMGARVALRMAVDSPAAVSALILESPSAGIAGTADREARRASDEDLARLVERDGIAAFVDRWEGLPLFASERAMPAEWRARLHAERMSCRPEGLAASLRGAGQGSMEPLHDRLSAVSVATLVIAGGLDAAGATRARAVAAAIPGAEIHVIEGVGHAPHREAPERVLPLMLHAIERNPS